MSELKATPGPWTAVPTSGDMLPEVYAHGVSIFDISGEEANANAHLIASAPDLYAKLEDCVKRLRRCALLGGSGPEMVDGLCEQFEQALARARGDVR